MAEDRADMDIERVVAEHHQAVYRYAYRLTGSAADAEDLTQQVFLAACQRLDQVRKPESIRSWLFAILRNHFLREAERQRPVTATTVGLNLDALPADAEGNGEIDAQRLQEALNDLPPEFRVVVTMFYFEDCSYREIAEGLDLPIGTVMSRLARAKGHLRAKLFEPEAAAAARPET